MFKVEPIGHVRVKKTAEIVASQIRNAIVRGELDSGDTLPAEAQLIASFGVSRPTIREAVRILESENLIQVSRGARGGARINLPTSELVTRTLGLTLQSARASLADVYLARTIIEAPAAKMAAETRPKTAAAILRAHLQKEQEAIEDRTRLAGLIIEFHRLLVEQAHNKTLALVVSSLYELTEKHVALVHRHREDEPVATQNKRFRVGLRSHEKLIALIEAGDGNGAQKHWEDQMKKATEYWLRGQGASPLDILD